MKKSGKGRKGSGNRERGTGNGKRAESRPRGLKTSRPGKTIKRSSAAGPKADQKRADPQPGTGRLDRGHRNRLRRP